MTYLLSKDELTNYTALIKRFQDAFDDFIDNENLYQTVYDEQHTPNLMYFFTFRRFIYQRVKELIDCDITLSTIKFIFAWCNLYTSINSTTESNSKSFTSK